MSYLKLFKTCSDHAVGEQCVNQALDNNRALYFDQFDPRHSIGIDGKTFGRNEFLVPGRHDDVLVARTVADFAIDATSDVLALVNGPMFAGASRLKAGQWKIFLNTSQVFSAAATIKGATAGVARYATCFVSFDSTGPFVTVSTWNASGGVLADYDFSLAIWAVSAS